MPFTPAHAAAVLPLVRRGRVLPPALVVGSMGPDLTFYLPLSAARAQSHSLAWAFTWTAALALAGWALWRWLLAAPVRDLMPAPVRARWAPADPARGPSRTARLWLTAYGCVVAGTLTHLFWDGFTHHGDWAAGRLPVLHVVVAGLPVYAWLQWVSSALGLAAVVLYAAWHLARTAPRPAWAARPHGPMLGWRVVTAGSLVVLPGAVLAWHLLVGSRVFVLLTESMSVALGVAVLSAVAWHVVRQPARHASMSASAAARTSAGARLARTDADARAASSSSVQS